MIRAEGPRILLDPDAARDARSRAARAATVEPRAAGAWLAHSLAAEAGGSIQLCDPAAEVLLIGVTLARLRRAGLTPR